MYRNADAESPETAKVAVSGLHRTRAFVRRRKTATTITDCRKTRDSAFPAPEGMRIIGARQVDEDIHLTKL
jgi:hypothetical protein